MLRASSKAMLTAFSKVAILWRAVIAHDCCAIDIQHNKKAITIQKIQVGAKLPLGGAVSGIGKVKSLNIEKG